MMSTPTPLSLTCPCTKSHIPLHPLPLPLTSHFCTCLTCRRPLGFSHSLLAALPKTTLDLASPQARTSTLWTFDTGSEHGKKYFCDECGAGLYYLKKGGEVEVFLPALDVRVLGAVMRLPEEVKEVLGRLPRWQFPPEKEKVEGEEAELPDEIVGRCACEGVSVHLQRPPKGYKEEEVLKEWIVSDPHGTPGFAANHCFCDPCRKYPSAPAWSWMFVPTSQLELKSTARSDGKPALKQISSSPGVVRRFCAGCGCHLSFAKRPEMWDIALGVFEPEELMRGRWVRWWYEGDGVKRTTLEKYVAGWVENEPSFPGDGIGWCGELVRAYEEFVEEKRGGEGW